MRKDLADLLRYPPPYPVYTTHLITVEPTTELDLDKLSLREIANLEDRIREHKKRRKDLRVYEVKFHFGFLQGTRGYGSGTTDYPECFKDYLEQLSESLIKKMDIRAPEGVSDFYVVELDPKEFPGIFTP